MNGSTKAAIIIIITSLRPLNISYRVYNEGNCFSLEYLRKGQELLRIKKKFNVDMFMKRIRVVRSRSEYVRTIKESHYSHQLVVGNVDHYCAILCTR